MHPKQRKLAFASHYAVNGPFGSSGWELRPITSLYNDSLDSFMRYFFYNGLKWLFEFREKSEYLKSGKRSGTFGGLFYPRSAWEPQHLHNARSSVTDGICEIFVMKKAGVPVVEGMSAQLHETFFFAHNLSRVGVALLQIEHLKLRSKISHCLVWIRSILVSSSSDTLVKT